MIRLKTGLEGRKTQFGVMQSRLEECGYHLGGNWDYHTGYFDRVLNREEGETIYIRAPFDVIAGMLDQDNASIQFKTPYIIKHVVNTGFDSEENSLLTSTFNQFQEPLDKDGRIPDKSQWQEIGVREVNRLLAILE